MVYGFMDIYCKSCIFEPLESLTSCKAAEPPHQPPVLQPVHQPQHANHQLFSQEFVASDVDPYVLPTEDHHHHQLEPHQEQHGLHSPHYEYHDGAAGSVLFQLHRNVKDDLPERPREEAIEVSRLQHFNPGKVIHKLST